MFKIINFSILHTIVSKFFLIILKAGIGLSLANFLGPLGKGTFFAFQSITGILSSYSTLSSNESIIYHYSQEKIIKNSLIQINIFFLILVTTISSLFLFLLMKILPNLFIEISNYKNYMYLILPLFAGETFSHFSLRALKQFKLFNLLGLLTRTNILIILIFALYFDNNIDTAIRSFILASSINLIISYGFLIKLTLPLRLTKLNYKEIIYYGLKVHLGSFLSESEYKFDIYFVLYLLGAASLGIYSVSLSVVSLLTYIPNSIINVIYSYTSSNEEDVKYQLTNFYIKYLFLFQIIISIFFIIIMKFLIIFLYGIEFADSYLIMLLLFPGVFLDNLSKILINFYKSKNILKIVNIVSLSSLIINCLLMLVLIPTYGLAGAAISTTISYSVKFLVLFYYYIADSKKMNIKNDFFKYSELKDIFYEISTRYKK